jgi:uncharacterized protein YbaR (Trm112 family)
MAIDLAPALLDILACPNCHGSLAVDHDRDELVCLAADCGLAYPVRQGIPVLLIDEARRPGPDLPVGSASSASSATPTESTTSADSPTSETPASEAPTSETPASEAPTSETPASEAPTSETPASEAGDAASGSGTSAASSASAASPTSSGSPQSPGSTPRSNGASADGDERP